MAQPYWPPGPHLPPVSCSYLRKVQDQEHLHQQDATNEVLKPDADRAQQVLEQSTESPVHSTFPLASLAPLTECSLPIHHLEQQSNLNSISLGTVPWSHFLENVDLSVYPWTTLGLDSFHRVIYLLCCWWESAKTLFLRTWAYGTTSQPERLSPQPAEISFQRDSRFWQTVAGGISFIKNNIQLLEMYVSKKVSQKLWKEKGKDDPFFTPLSPGYPPDSLGNLLKSQNNERHTMKNLLWETKTGIWQSASYPQGFYSKHELDPGDLKRSQFFWGLPSLHSESLVASAWLQARSSSGGSRPFTFNNIFLTEPPPKGTLHFSRPQDVAQPQLETSKLPLPAPKVLTEDHFPYSFPNQLHLTPLQINTGRTSGPISEQWAQSLFPNKHHDLEWSLKEQLKCGEVLTSKFETTQKIINQPTPNLPQDSNVPQINKLDTTFSGNSVILECQKSEEEPQSQEEVSKYKWQHFPSLRLPESPLMQHQDTFPEKIKCQPQNKHEPPQTSQPTELTCESKIESTFSNEVQVALHLDNPGKGIEQDLERDPIKAVEISNVSESDWMMHKKYSGSHSPRTLDKKYLEVHLQRKLEQVKQGMIPVRVRQSFLTSSRVFSRPNAPSKPNVASCTNQPSRVNTFQELSFLDTKSRLMLETNTVSCRMKHRWYPQLQACDSNFSLQEDLLPQPVFPSATSCDSKAKPEEHGQKDSGKEEMRNVSVASLKRLFSALSAEEIQRSQGQNPSSISHGHLEACPSEQNSLPLMPRTSSLLSRTVPGTVKESLEPRPSPVMACHKPQEESVDMVSRDPSLNGTTLKIKLAFPPPVTKDAKETEEVKKELPPKPEVTVATSLLQNTQIINFKSSVSQGTNNSPSPSRNVLQDPGHARQKAQVIREIQCKLGIASKQPQSLAMDNLRRSHTDKLSMDNLSSKASLTSTPSMFKTKRDLETSQVPHDLSMKERQSHGEQEPRDIRVKAQGQKQSNMFDSQADRQDHGKSGPGLGERAKPSQSWEPSPPPQDRRVGSNGRKTSQGAGPHPSEKTKMQNFLPFLNPDTGKQEKKDSLPRVECPLASTQSQESETSKLCAHSGATEAQALVMPAGQTLLNKTGLWHGHDPFQLYYHGKESQYIHSNYQDIHSNYQDIHSNDQDMYSNYHMHPSDPEQTSIHVSYGHQASHRGPGPPTKNRYTTNKTSNLPLLPREPVFLASPCWVRLDRIHASRYICHHPMCYHQKSVLSS
ncbi:spermatogenesis-associated protein 31E1-like [Perognathus longimembris pacificus]|uniref:spermatogenesis-associated protein 31E1-like n=1 Tax=Perognathus longimembris pacificus TaxID=214514 RepID=UPI00201A12C7|nr:spermatogenesis-associated protein 31E1-like [Perognathus longimembris pacificus]